MLFGREGPLLGPFSSDSMEMRVGDGYMLMMERKTLIER